MTTEWRLLLSQTMDGEPLSAEELDILARSLRDDACIGEALAALRLEAALHRHLRRPDPEAALLARERLLARALLLEKRQSHRVPAQRRLTPVRLAAAAAVLLALGAAAGLLIRTPPSAPPAPTGTGTTLAILESAVDASLALTNGTRGPAKAGTPLRAGDRVSTAADGSVRLWLAGEPTRVDLGGDTALRLLPDAPGRRLRLDFGSLDAEVAPQPPGRPMTIATPHAVATILGTRLALRSEYEQTRLAVESGRVRLERTTDGSSVVVEPGRTTTARREPAGPMEAVAIAAPSSPPPPAAPRILFAPRGFTAYGGRWVVLDGTLLADAGEGPRLAADGLDVAEGEVGVEVFFPDRDSGNAGLVTKLRDSGVGADRFTGYEIALDPSGRFLRLGRHEQDYTLIRDTPCDVPIGRWIPLVVRMTETTLEVSVGGARVDRYEEKARPLRSGGIALRTWLREARFRDLWVRSGGERKPLPFLQESP